MQPTSETKSKCEEPWNDLSTRKQRALLLEGVEITRAFLVQLKELMQMNNDEGEPCGYDEVLQAVLWVSPVLHFLPPSPPETLKIVRDR